MQAPIIRMKYGFGYLNSPAPPARPREAGVFLHRTTDYPQRRTNSRQNADQGLNDHFPNRFLVHSSFVF